MATWQPNITESRKELVWWGTLSFNVQADNVMRAILKASGALSEIERLTKALEELEMELQDANEHIEMLENS